MNIIAQILNRTDEKHQQETFNTFLLWCELNTTTRKELQAAVCNQSLLNWFHRKHEKLELIFYDQVGSNELQINELIQMHAAATIQIRNYYPPRNILNRIIKNGLQDAVNFINN
jgi:hypothetical protein